MIFNNFVICHDDLRKNNYQIMYVVKVCMKSSLNEREWDEMVDMGIVDNVVHILTHE